MLAAVICKEYGWTYEEYMNAPAPFIDNIVAMYAAQNKK